MQFPCVFQRPTTTWSATDTLPAAPAQSATGGDNILQPRRTDSNGMPPQKIAVGGMGPTGGPATFTANLYFFETSTGQWWKIGSGITITMGVAGGVATLGTITYVDAFAVMDSPVNTANAMNPAPGSPPYCLIVTNPGALTAGTYTFWMAPVYTTNP
jgi:hypothetical protein